MRVLFQMPQAGYLRQYAGTITRLARKHDVLLSYDTGKYRPADADRIEALTRVEVVARMPERDDGWTPLVHYTRLTADYIRYLDPRFESNPWLRQRMEKYLPLRLERLTAAPTISRTRYRAAQLALGLIEDGIAPDARKLATLDGLKPDAVVVTPVISRGPSSIHQRDTVKAAKALGIPVAIAVGSWDHLTSKGIMSVQPDRIYVWNELQRDEAVELHGADPARVVVTGAQAFDQWFDRTPSTTAVKFAKRVGLDPDRPFFLYVGSSPNIISGQDEREVVREWLRALRDSFEPAAAEAGVLVRPHPGNIEAWADEDLSEYGNVAISPRERPDLLMTAAEEAHYFDSLHHSLAVVGINTSAMVEAAIVGRGVYSWRHPRYAATQEGTKHFHLLLPESGGCVRLADTLDDHIMHLEVLATDQDRLAEATRAFVSTFVRPRGMSKAASTILANEIIGLAETGRRRPARASALARGLASTAGRYARVTEGVFPTLKLQEPTAPPRLISALPGALSDKALERARRRQVQRVTKHLPEARAEAVLDREARLRKKRIAARG